VDGVISRYDIEVLEFWADLKLAPERREAMAGLLAGRIRAANELSRLMAEPRHRALTPAVRFLHPKSQEQQS
jgi:hypothetical protein